MSYYVDVDGEQAQLASTSGWADVVEWADKLPAAGYGEVLHLVDHGWSDEVAALGAQIDRALTEVVPPAASVAKTLHHAASMMHHDSQLVRVIQ